MNIVGALLIACVAGSVIGASTGYLRPAVVTGESADHAGAMKAPADNAKRAHLESALRELKPIIVNLKSPAGSWVRLEAALIFDSSTQADRDRIAADISGDFAAYLETIGAEQLEGALGLQFLREDLRDRAAARAGNTVREVVIETLVIQ